MKITRKRRLAQRSKVYDSCKYTNLTGNTATILSSSEGKFKSLLITNAHASDAVIIDIYQVRTVSGVKTGDYGESSGGEVVTEGMRGGPTFQPSFVADTTVTYYILKSVKIPKGASLLLDEKDLIWKYTNNYEMYIKLDQADSSVTLRTEGKLGRSGGY